MARIVLGMAMPHTAMQVTSPEAWLAGGERDRKNPDLWFRNRHVTFDELVELRRTEGLGPHMTLDERKSRGERVTRALDELRRVYRENKPDVAVVIGKDQKEVFSEPTPSLAVFSGAELPNVPPQRAAFAPDAAVTYPGHPELARHLIEALEAEGFDMAEVSKMPPNAWMQQTPIVQHAYSFVYHQIMGNEPPPSVPVFMNTFFPPNQPSIGRSIAFGRALVRAILAWDSDKTVGIFASGGLSHFICDEELDAEFLACFKTFDFERLAKIDERSFQSGTSEVKLFVPVLVALAELECEMRLIDYVPVYRSEAGSGEGLGYLYGVIQDSRGAVQ